MIFKPESHKFVLIVEPLLIKKHIRPLLAAGIALIFTISVIPQKYLHGLFANHENILVAVSDGNSTNFKIVSECDCNKIVIISPYTVCVIDTPTSLLATYSPLKGLKTKNLDNPLHCFLGLRGPPMV